MCARALGSFPGGQRQKLQKDPSFTLVFTSQPISAPIISRGRRGDKALMVVMAEHVLVDVEWQLHREGGLTVPLTPVRYA